MMFEEPAANAQVDAEASAIMLGQETVTVPSTFITSQNVDEWIEQLKCCRLLSENNVQLLCEKVLTNEQLSIPFLGHFIYCTFYLPLFCM